MKILFSSYKNPHFPSITEYTASAFEKLGHELFFLNDRDFILPGRIRDNISFLGGLDLRRLNSKLLSAAGKVDPDICLVAGGHRIFSDTVGKISGGGVKTALWTIDSPKSGLDFLPIVKSAPSYDKVFCGGTEAVELLAENGIKNAVWLPFACDPDVHKPSAVSAEDRKKYGHDIVFVGSYYPNRAELFESIKDFDFAVWGPGWEKASCFLKKHIVASLGLKYEEWLKIYSSAKIVVMAHYQDGKNPCYQASPRVYEALACGSFLLCDRQKDALSLFEEGKHLAVYDNSSDLKEKAEYYLSNNDERIKIAAEGREKAVNQHTYQLRIKKMLAVMTT